MKTSFCYHRHAEHCGQDKMGQMGHSKKEFLKIFNPIFLE